MTTVDEFYEDDERPEDVAAAFDGGTKLLTTPSSSPVMRVSVGTSGQSRVPPYWARQVSATSAAASQAPVAC